MAAASAASGFRTWMQSQNIPWLTPRRMRRLTIGAMCAAGVVCTIGFSGSGAAEHTRLPRPADVRQTGDGDSVGSSGSTGRAEARFGTRPI